MQQVRQVVTMGLEKRTKANIKVRQPLSTLIVRSTPLETLEQSLREQFADIVADELNVKEVSFIVQADGESHTSVELDTTITPELKREGEYRDILRSVQELRKNTGLNPGDRATLVLPSIHKDTVEPFLTDLKKVANLADISFGGGDMSLARV
jgi:isoleucyl-tRNA synthetase